MKTFKIEVWLNHSTQCIKTVIQAKSHQEATVLAKAQYPTATTLNVYAS